MSVAARIEETLLVRRGELDAKFFRGLADPVRVSILELLLDGEMNVTELVQALGMSQSRISMHLTCLRWCGLATTRREGRYIYYRIADPRVREILTLARAVIAENAERILACDVIEDS